MADSSLLLTDGTPLLLTDGTGLLLAESAETAGGWGAAEGTSYLYPDEHEIASTLRLRIIHTGQIIATHQTRSLPVTVALIARTASAHPVRAAAAVRTTRTTHVTHRSVLTRQTVRAVAARIHLTAVPVETRTVRHRSADIRTAIAVAATLELP